MGLQSDRTGNTSIETAVHSDRQRDGTTVTTQKQTQTGMRSEEAEPTILCLQRQLTLISDVLSGTYLECLQKELKITSILLVRQT